jgi:YD repeat-containing protein
MTSKAAAICPFTLRGPRGVIEQLHGNAVLYGYTGDRLTSINDATGVVFTFAYDTDGHVTHVDAANGERVEYAYDADGNLISATRVRGAVTTTYAYDDGHRITSSVGPDGLERIRAVSDVWNRSTEREDLRGNLAEFQYATDPTGGGRITTVEDVYSGLTSTTALDSFNRPTARTDGLGRTVHYGYDPASANGNPTSIQLPDPARAEIQFTYNAEGRIVSVFDPENDPDGNGYTQQFFYDGQQNLVRHVDAREIETTFVYDTNNNLTQVQRGGTVWQYTYYANGLLQSVSNPCSHATTYFYDSRGNLTKVRDAAGAETVYAYDALNRMHTMTDPLGRAVNLTYNDFDQVVRVDVPQGHMTYQYDAASKRLTSVGDFKGQDTVYAYDAQTGDLISETADGATVSYTYDRHGRLASLRDHEGTKTVFFYDELGRPAVTMTSFDETVALLRDAEIPWTIVHGTLVIAGRDAVTQGDSILMDTGDDGVVTLTINLKSYFLDATAFDAVYVDAGDGDDLVDLRSVPAGVNATILGGAGSDILLAGPGNDVLFGGDGADWIEGGGGDDWIFGGKDTDVLFGHISTSISIFEDADATTDRLFGGDGNDLLYSRWQDRVAGGAGANSHFGIQADGKFRLWAADDVPLGLTGRMVLVGNERDNQIVIKQYGDKLLVTVDQHTRIVDQLAFDFVAGLFRTLIVLPSGGANLVDLSQSPVPVFFFGGPGGNTVTGSNHGNILIGGSGADTLTGGAGNDTLIDGRGADVLDGVAGNNYVFTSDDGSPDVMRGAQARGMYALGDGNDRVQNTRADDLVVPPGARPPVYLDVPESDIVVTPTNYSDKALARQQARLGQTDDRSASPAQQARPAEPVRLSSRNPQPYLYTNQKIYEQGDGASFTIFTNMDTWARLRILADLDGDGNFEKRLAESRIGKGNLGIEINTSALPVGTFSVRALIETYDGKSYYTAPEQIRIRAAQLPDALPATINLSAGNLLALVPHQNGDVNLFGNPLWGASQIDLWELTPRHNSNFRAHAQGMPTVVAWYDAMGNRIGFPDNDGEITISLLGDHTYYFAVTPQGNASGVYDLVVTGTNQTIQDTIEVPPGAFRGSSYGEMTTSHRLDYFMVTAPISANRATITVHTTPGLRVWVRLADQYNNTVGLGETGSAGWDNLLTNRPVVGGRLYNVTVYGLYGTKGDYSVTVDFDPDEVGLPETIAVYPLPDYKPLIPLADGNYSLSGLAISSPGEYDYFWFTPSQPGEYVLQTRGSLDTQMVIYHGSGAWKLAESDNDGPGDNARIAMNFSNRDEYWIVVRAAGNATGAYALDLFGPDQPITPITIAGLAHTGEGIWSMSNQSRQKHFSVVAPNGTETLDIVLSHWSTSPDYHADDWLAIQDSAGNLTVVDNYGEGQTESLIGYPVQAGETYWITAYGTWSGSAPTLRLMLDFNPNFSGSGEIPVNSSTNGYQRYPAIAMNNAGRSVFAWIGDGQGSTYDTWDDDVFYQVFDSAGQAVGTEKKANLQDGEIYQKEASAGMSSTGAFVIAWIAPPDPYGGQGPVKFRRFDAQGTPLQAGETDAGLSGNSARIAVGAQGEFMLVATNGTLIQGRLFDAAGNAVTGVLTLDETLDEKHDLDIAVDGAGNYLVTWSSVSDDRKSIHAYAIRLDASGNFLPSGRNGYVAGNVAGRWFHDVNQNGIQDPGEPVLGNVTLFLDSNGNGVRDGSEPQVNTDPDGDYAFADVAAGIHRILPIVGGTGGPATVGDDFNRDDSTELGPAWVESSGDFRIEGNLVRAAHGAYAAMTYQDFSGFDQVVTFDLYHSNKLDWYDHRDAYADVYLAQGDASHYVAVRVADNDHNDGIAEFNRLYFRHGQTPYGWAWPRMKLKNGSGYYIDPTPFNSARILAAYDSHAQTLVVGIDADFDGHYEQLFHAGGVPADGLGDQVAIGAYNNVAIDNFAVHRNLAVIPDIAVSPGEEFRVAPDQHTQQRYPRVDANGTGQFAVVWQAQDLDGTGDNIYARIFGSDALAVSPLIPVNRHRSDSQRLPDVAMKNNGEIVAVWQSYGQDGSGQGVYARQFDASGQSATLEDLRINDITADNQWFPAIASDRETRFGFAWHGYFPWDGNGFPRIDEIFGRFLDFPDIFPQPLLTIMDDSGDSSDRQIDFGAVIQHQAAPAFTITIRNGGTAMLEGSLSLAGPHAAAFSIVGDTTLNLAPGQSRAVPVTLATETRGARRADLVLTHNAVGGMSIVELTGAIVPVADAREDNDTIATAPDIGIITHLILPELTMHRVDDVDYFRFQVDQPSMISVAAAFGHDEGDLDFAVLDQNLKLIAAGASRTDNEFAVVHVRGEEPIYLHVYGTGPVANAYDLTITQYRLGIQVDRPSIVVNDGPSAALGTVTRQTGDASTPLTVTLASSDVTKLTVPHTVTIPAHAHSITFPIDAIDNSVPDGAQLVTITASADGHVPGSEVIEVVDLARTRMDMTIVHTPSTAGEHGEVATLPASVDWVHEWQSFWVEIWVSTPDTTVYSLAEATVDLQYPSSYLTAQEIAPGPAFAENAWGTIDDASGMVRAMGGQTARTDLGKTGYVLLARVRFASTGDDQVPVDEGGRKIGPFAMPIGLASGQTEVHGGGVPMPTLASSPSTELWAVMYDIDDNGQVDFGDFSYFAAAFGRTVGEPTPNPPYVWWADFDGSGRVDFGDLAFFAPNFGKTRSAVQAGDQTLVFPPNFPDAWRAGTGDGGGQAQNGGEGEAVYGAGILAAFGDLYRVSALLLEHRAGSDAVRGALRPRQETGMPDTVLWLADAGRESPTNETTAQHARRRPAEDRRNDDNLDRWEPLDDLLTLVADRSSGDLGDDVSNRHDTVFTLLGRRSEPHR